MAAMQSAATPLSDEEARRQLRRAVIASTIGTTIEWYDFFLYSTVTGLLRKAVFPAIPPTRRYAAGVPDLCRRLRRTTGRRGDLRPLRRPHRPQGHTDRDPVADGAATFAVAFVPTYAAIGIWGAVILTVLRFIQGVGVGGEWGGSVLMSMEWARTNAHRGFVASWPQFGVPAGLFLANLAVLAMSWFSGNAFLTWGWRVPFILSVVLVAIEPISA